MIARCPLCGAELRYQKTLIREKFYKIKADGTLCKTPEREAVNKPWSQDESGLICTNCSFTLIPTQTTSEFQSAARYATGKKV